MADLHRRAQVSQAANERYLEALAAVEQKESLGQLAARLCRPVTWNGQRARALNPHSSEDARLLETVSRGEFTLNGFRNRDLQAFLYRTKPASIKEARSRSGAVTRKLRQLRAHGLIRKLPNTHRYMLTQAGAQGIAARSVRSALFR